MVARQNSQPARINRQRFVQPKFRGEISDQQSALFSVGLTKPSLFRQMLLEFLMHPFQMRKISIILRRRRQPALLDASKHLHGVVTNLIPQLTIEPSEELDR